MFQKAGNLKKLKYAALICGSLSFVVGFIVLFGWYTHNSIFIQVLPSFVPMQYNTALGFLLCGAGLFATPFNRKRIAIVCGSISGLIGLLTLVQYIFGIDFGIDQLFMEHYVTVATSHPGRMAPNTALCFTLSGLALVVMNRIWKLKQHPLLAGLLGSLITALGIVAFFGYLSGVEKAYGWGDLTRMAVHTALGFMLLGIGMFAEGWREGLALEGGTPRWMPVPVGIGVTTIAVVQWQAIAAQTHTPLLPTVVLVGGLLMAALLTLTVQLAQKLANRAKELENEIKKREQLEEHLRHSQKMEAIGTLAGGIAHDFNNILSIIFGYTELAILHAEDKNDDKNKYNLENILKASLRAKGLVKQILAFSQKDKEAQEQVSIADIVTETISMLRKALSPNIRIRTDIDHNLDRIMANPTQIHQIVMNLCTNAAHAMKDKGGTLDISLKGIQLENGIIGSNQTKNTNMNSHKFGRFQQLTISDTGHGMDAETLERIFDPYFTTKPVGEGSGMGLSVTHGIVKNHGGEITAHSQKGKGSCFNVFLPESMNDLQQL